MVSVGSSGESVGAVEASLVEHVADLRRSVRSSPCPGLFRVVDSADGGICRIKLPLGQVTAAQARVVAQAARTAGNGVIEVTNRCNLQLRGMDGMVPASGSTPTDAAIASLLAAGLGSMDAGADDVRNVMVSASAGRGGEERVDVTALAEQALAMMAGETRFHQVSPKFSILLDGGSDGSPVEHRHDIWLSAYQDEAGALLYAFGVAGHPPLRRGAMVHGQAAGATGGPAVGDVVGAVPVAAGLTLLRVLLTLFCDEAESRLLPRRYRSLLAVMPIEELRAQVQQRLAAALGQDLMRAPASCRTLADWRRPLVNGWPQVGLRLQKDGCWMLGAVPPLGRMTPEMLETCARLAERFSSGTLRLTPWQSLLFVDLASPAEAAVLEAELVAAGLATEASDPLVGMVACAGTSGCRSAFSETKADALALAALLRDSHNERPDDARPALSLHLTACPKSCAASRVAETTLVALPEGGYDLYRRDDHHAEGFGQRLARGVTVPQAASLLTALRPTSSVAPSGKPAATMLDYIRDAHDIYRRSFAIIRAEADLTRIPADLEKLAVRVAHACGMPDVINDLLFSDGAGAAGRQALADGAPIFCDCRMVADGITRARLPAENDVICTLNDPAVPELAREMGTTRSAAALELWRPRLKGSVVAIGNAPTALFRLLEMLDDGADHPALILGIPVGFVGAAESKDALAADSRGVPFVAVRGRRGGSAMTAAAINALATERE